MNANVTIRMNEELKAQADAVLAELGMSFTTAVNVFARQVVRRRAIPFEITAAPVETANADVEGVDPVALASAVAFAEQYHDDFTRLAQ